MAVRVQPSVVGGAANAGANAAAVAFGCSSAAIAPRAAARPRRRDEPPDHREGAVEQHELVEDDLAFGEGAGLVEAHHVDARKTFDRRELLDEHVAPGERERGDTERDAREEHEPFGHHADHAGNRAAERFVERVIRELTPEQQRRHRDEDPGDDPQDEVDAVHQLGAGELELARLRRQLAGVGVATDARGLEPSAPGHHEASRQHLGIGDLVDRVALPGEQRLVDLEAVGGAHDAVARDLVTESQLEQVVEHDRLDRDVLHHAVAHHTRDRRVEHRELIKGALRPQLLDDPDQRVGDEHDAEQAVLDRTDHDDHGEHRAENGVEPREHVGADDLAQGATGALP